MPFGFPCDHTVAIIHHSNVPIPCVLTAFPAFCTDFTNQCHYVKKCHILIQHLWTNCTCILPPSGNYAMTKNVFIFILFACLLTIFPLSMLQLVIAWGKPYQSVTYLSWTGPCLTFYRAWAAFCGHVFCHIIRWWVWFVFTLYAYI